LFGLFTTYPPPPPPPAEVIVLKTESEPTDPPLPAPALPAVPPAPPAPTVIVYVLPAVTGNAVPVRKPPPPPPPAIDAPPPPPPATTRYSTSVTPVGAVHVLEDVNVKTIVRPKPQAGFDTLFGFNALYLPVGEYPKADKVANEKTLTVILGNFYTEDTE
jgi:hypothetical protein